MKLFHTDRAKCAEVRQKQQTERNQGNLQKRLDIADTLRLRAGELLQDAQTRGCPSQGYTTHPEAKASLGSFIDDVYNVKRLISRLDYLPPVEFEATEALKTTRQPTGT